ncbi:MAG: MFS transporter [Endomicrobium sp.]|jgi:OPA family glycerol-3-phosphate transporter-like MFS transporter/OPA family sugar phosphate sensor protein UhpC-like MFS transporter|nr:MFS transporter [Endomicrobium sp.]
MRENRKFIISQIKLSLSLMVCYTLYYFLRKNFSVAVPFLNSDLGISKTTIGLIMTLHGLTYGISRFLCGMACDKFSAAKIFKTALLLSCFISFVLGFQTTAIWIGVLWVLNAMAQACGYPPVTKMQSNWVHPEKFATWTSIVDTGHSLGAFLIVIACGYIATSWGWQWCFWSPIGIVLIGIMLTHKYIKDCPSQLGFDNLENKKSVQLFTRKEYFQIISENVFRNKPLLIIAISQIGVYCLRFAILDWGPTLLKETKQVSLINAVWVVAIFEAAGVLGTLSSGFVTDRFFGGRAHRTSQVSLALSLTSLILFLAIPNATMGVYLLLLSLAGFFTYSAQIQGTTAVAKLATRSAAGTASGFIGLCAYLSVIFTGFGVGIITQNFGWTPALVFLVSLGFIAFLIRLSVWNAKADGYGDK